MLQPLAEPDHPIDNFATPSEPSSSTSPPSSPAGDAAFPLRGERLAFTGVLASMTHREAHQLAFRLGGQSSEHVSRQTTMLVVGEEGWPLENDGRPSVKLQHVTQWQAEGLTIRVVTESDWLAFVGLRPPEAEFARSYTPAVLSGILRVGVRVIRRWERLGLIRPVRRVCRLPYFDFREVSSVRKLVELIDQGVSVRQLQQSLTKLRGIIPDIDRPLAALEVLSHGGSSEVLYRTPQGNLSGFDGQLRFEFDREAEFDPAATAVDSQPTIPLFPTDNATNSAPGPRPAEHEPARSDAARSDSPRPETGRIAEWFEQGECHAEEGLLDEALRDFRRVLVERPTSSEAQLAVADVLYRLGDASAARERVMMATELDPTHVPAWVQRGCLQVELGQVVEGMFAFRRALELHPDCADAHWHLAELLHQQGDIPQAISHWERYLTYDDRGPWAQIAAEKLQKFSTHSP